MKNNKDEAPIETGVILNQNEMNMLLDKLDKDTILWHKIDLIAQTMRHLPGSYLIYVQSEYYNYKASQYAKDYFRLLYNDLIAKSTSNKR